MKKISATVDFVAAAKDLKGANEKFLIKELAVLSLHENVLDH